MTDAASRRRTKENRYMNSKKFKDALYEHREVTDIKDLITSSAELYEQCMFSHVFSA